MRYSGRGLRCRALFAAVVFLWYGIGGMSVCGSTGGQDLRNPPSDPSFGIGTKQIALTFDDGPHPIYTEQILSLCAEYGVHVTFFVVGENVRQMPELVAREIAEGHEVGNHTDTHPNLAKCNTQQIRKELVAAENAIFSAADYRPHLFRPPGGGQNPSVRKAAGWMDYQLVLWSVDTRDWAATTTVDSIVNNVMEHAEDGAIVLFHDYVGGESRTIAALRRILPMLLAEGYTFVTVSQLFGRSNV